MKPVLKPLCAAVGAAGMLVGVSGGAWASGFQLMEQNASQLGNAYAGTAAAAEDASTIYFNPAGMSRLKGRDFAVSLNAIRPSSEFENRGSTLTNNGVAIPGLTGDNGGDAGDWALLPAIYYAHAIDNKWSLGISVNAPFGLKTDYDAGFIGRFQGLKSELETLAITPTVSYKVNDQLALGVGVRAQRADATLTSATSPLLPGAVNTLEGDDWGFGFSLGVLYQATPNTRLGASYQSSIDYTLEGTLVSPGVPGGVIPVTADLELPDIATVSVVHQLNPQWELLADVAWTNWSKFRELRVVGPTGATVSQVPQNWDDTWRFALGANYRYNDKLKFRVGVAFDETPTSDEFRTVRIPDEDRIWLAFGVQYKVTPNGTLDIGYVHIFVDDPRINKKETLGAGPTGTRVVGEVDADVNIIGVQYSHSF